ncbi:hypothetical protein [Rhodocaloribacter sp.]
MNSPFRFFSTRLSFTFAALLGWIAWLTPGVYGQANANVSGNTDALPFTLEIVDVVAPSLPGLHSFAHAQYGGKWVFVGGRTDGRHSLGTNAFPPDLANEDIWVFDPATWQTWSAPVTSLPDAVADPLRATNTQFAQNGEYLYVAGGYGIDTATGDYVTFPTLTALHLPGLIDAVMNGTALDPHVRQITDARMQTTGGEMRRIGAWYYLLFGHDFEGAYSTDPGAFTQTYTEQLRMFQITDDGVTFSITNYVTLDDTDAFHRRDLTVAPVVFPDETLGLGAYAGVFQKTADLPFLNPIYVREDAHLLGANAYTVDTAFDQMMSQYTCPTLPVFDPATGDMYTTFFGGIGQYFLDDTGTLVEDPAVPFIDEVTTLTRAADGTSSEAIWPFRMPQPFGSGLRTFLGANMAFLPNESLTYYDNGVLKLDAITGRTLVGHLYGGILAFGRNFAGSMANNNVYEVYLDLNTPLPVELAAFDAVTSGRDALLTWTTASETNNAGFYVERRGGGEETWRRLGFVEGRGTTSETTHYAFRAEALAPGRHTFRLRQVDFDGAFAFGPEVEVFVEVPGAFVLSEPYPNPFNPQTRFTLTTARTQRVRIEVVDVLGRRVRLLHDGELRGGAPETFTFEAAGLPSGPYQIRALGETFVAARSVMLLK